MITTTQLEGFSYSRLTTQGADINVASAGSGPPLLLLHGYPQTHYMWHKTAPALSQHFHVICPDLRGYGDSSKPESNAQHTPYSKREMAKDMVEIMQQLGHNTFYVAGHDRGARVAHRMILDYPTTILKAAVLDIVPTIEMFNSIDQISATGYYHWFFLIQSNGLPEKMIGQDPDYYLNDKLNRWSTTPNCFEQHAIDEYLRCFREPSTIHATCEDYRAAASIDLEHDKADLDKKINCPLLVLWGEHGIIGRHFDLLEIWNQCATNVTGQALNCGHFLAEESPDETLDNLTRFFNN
ncbi:MAG TPA: alpha/beta hydrolase [Cycloclasticus sp.]|jgi:haloacetate dehalogenase|nr:alpha/beta hydrolase [Cycloclasticus sp.]HIL93195.1 alpha/beta hydrolase [Cycloclasticus sp.]